MKLEVGMYVRSKNQGIFVISHINTCMADNDYRKVCLCQNEKVAFTNIDTIKELKVSYNIKRLLQVGDIISYEYITGLGMIRHDKVEINEHLLNVLQNGENNHEYHILKVLTKEQFEDRAYKVGE